MRTRADEPGEREHTVYNDMKNVEISFLFIVGRKFQLSLHKRRILTFFNKCLTYDD